MLAKDTATESPRVIRIILMVFIRIIVLFGIFILGLFTSTPVLNFIEATGYRSSDGFFGSSWGNTEIAWVLSSVFWGFVIFGTLGKKIDYIFYIILFLIAVWEYSSPPPVNTLMWLGFVGIIFIGSLVGFILKLLRQRFLTGRRK